MLALVAVCLAGKWWLALLLLWLCLCYIVLCITCLVLFGHGLCVACRHMANVLVCVYLLLLLLWHGVVLYILVLCSDVDVAVDVAVVSCVVVDILVSLLHVVCFKSHPITPSNQHQLNHSNKLGRWWP